MALAFMKILISISVMLIGWIIFETVKSDRRSDSTSCRDDSGFFDNIFYD